MIMVFSDYPYQRPDMDLLKETFKKQIDRFNKQNSPEGQLQILRDLNKKRQEFESQCSLVYIRHTQNTADPEYEKENRFVDENFPVYEELLTGLSKAMINSPFRKELEASTGPQMFRLAEMKLKSFSHEIVEQVQQENRLSSEYVKLLSSAEIDFQGEKRNLSQLTPFEQSSDRNIRQEAMEARFSYFEEQGEELDRIFDELVKLRTTMARKMGYKNYIPFGYYRMFRSDYGAAETAAFRRSVLKHLVPLAEELYQRQWKRTNIEEPAIWDESFRFASGNATPKGDRAWMEQQASQMYQELSPETDRFFRFMQQHQLLDLDSRKNKAGGGYCDMLSEWGSPFIFANFNGTSGDVDVLTHEAGHAFQVFSSREIPWVDYHFPTYEACEIHSMSMEYFAWPWMDLFFKEEADKYRFSHLADFLQFIPYGVTVDEFQHLVYENPEASPKERHQMWKQTAQKYHPSINYGGIAHLEKGGYWQKQGHIYKSPFYYIDYTLAETCALQYWAWMQKDREKAWSSYADLCRQGGRQSFLELISHAGLKSPFEEATLKKVISQASDWLNNMDDSAL